MDADNVISLGQWRREYLDRGETNATTTPPQRDDTVPTATTGTDIGQSAPAEAGHETVAPPVDEDRDPGESFYERLGVTPAVTAVELKDAFETITQRYDEAGRKTIKAEEAYQHYAQAYDILQNPRLRAWYDELGHDTFTEGWGSLEGWPDDVSPTTFASERGYERVSRKQQTAGSTVPSEAAGSSLLPTALAVGVVLVLLAVTVLYLLG